MLCSNLDDLIGMDVATVTIQKYNNIKQVCAMQLMTDNADSGVQSGSPACSI